MRRKGGERGTVDLIHQLACLAVVGLVVWFLIWLFLGDSRPNRQSTHSTLTSRQEQQRGKELAILRSRRRMSPNEHQEAKRPARQRANLEASKVEARQEARHLAHRIVERHDVSYPGCDRMCLSVVVDVDTIPSETALKELADRLWKSGNKHWDEFTVWIYLPDMEVGCGAYAVGEYRPHGLKEFRIQEWSLWTLEGIKEEAKQEREETRRQLVAQRNREQTKWLDGFEAFKEIFQKCEIVGVDKSFIVRCEPGDLLAYQVRIVVADEWHSQPYQKRLQGAQALWKTWASLHTPQDPDKSRIVLVDQMGKEVGGSRIWGGSLIWVSEKR